MSDLQSDDAATAKNEKVQRTARVLWLVLMPIFALLALWRVYNWTQGKDNLYNTLPLFGMIFVGLASITRPRNKNLATVFTVIALILVVGGLIAMFVY
jgi:cytochrome bd-type quinol oxidase subunit 2